MVLILENGKVYNTAIMFTIENYVQLRYVANFHSKKTAFAYIGIELVRDEGGKRKVREKENGDRRHHHHLGRASIKSLLFTHLFFTSSSIHHR